MSIHTSTRTRDRWSTETRVEVDAESNPSRTSHAPTPSFETHDSAATFDVSGTDRLPNTVDSENRYLGQPENR